MIIGLDHGFGAVKSLNFILTTGITEYEKEPYTTKNVIKYDGKYYICGSGRQTLVRDKTQDDSYYILTLCILAKELRYRNAGNKANVVLAVGLPLTSYGRDKEKFIKYLKRHVMQPVKFEFEGETYRIFIDDVIVYPQGCLAVLNNKSELVEQPSVIVCDFGSWTVDTVRLDKGRPVSDTCRSLEMGIIRMMDKILEEVRSSTGLSITSAQVERIMKNMPCILDEKAKEIVNKQGSLYIDKLLRTLMESGFDVTAIPTIFVGGGAALVEKNVNSKIYAKMEFIKDIRANAKAFEGLAKMLVGDKM